MLDPKVKLIKVTEEGLRPGSRRHLSYTEIKNGMLRSNYKGDRGDLDKMFHNGQIHFELDGKKLTPGTRAKAATAAKAPAPAKKKVAAKKALEGAAFRSPSPAPAKKAAKKAAKTEVIVEVAPSPAPPPAKKAPRKRAAKKRAISTITDVVIPLTIHMETPPQESAE